ncbi:zinc finger protein RTS2 [Emericellopsis cladophorae]|uniref:Zinc finger protein RTS2 n=1 Tax=Emericellopsis cladophorae TaxID=2686198 RepID=A0A9P9Y3D0_9HYPO|nr:zinc finger protein RTS2 [Emericellopsis cladophorae]KAI6782863.1 zinc finger protein RTS2 [Emericellopsis cladophorae]
MPKAEVGSTKHLSNKLKSKGLQRLRWYCQVCEKQCRDANGFKMHTQSESHVRQMLVVGEDPRKFINDFSNQFQRDFLTLLRTGHGEKEVQINRFYQEYIANKEHVHMNSTKWPSLTEFAKHLGREGICRVEENEKGIHIAWIDNSPEALRRRNALKRKEAEDQGNEEVEQRMIREQIKRAQANARHDKEEERDAAERELKRQEGEKITLSFGGGAKSTPKAESSNPTVEERTPEASGQISPPKEQKQPQQEEDRAPAQPAGFGGVSLKLGGKPQTKNVFAQAKKNALSGGKKGGFIDQPKKMSEAERIMKEEMERKRSRGSGGFSMPVPKKQKSS